MKVKYLINLCNNYDGICGDCTRKKTCNKFHSIYGTTPYLMNLPHIAQDHDFNYEEEKDKEL